MTTPLLDELPTNTTPGDSQQSPLSSRQVSKFDDALLLGIMASLAGCGLIYEYLLSHYAGRILGALEAAIYTMIGLMIVSMGVGAFAARKIKCCRDWIWSTTSINYRQYIGLAARSFTQWWLYCQPANP